MKLEEMRKKTVSELQDLLLQSKKEKLSLRFQKVNGQMESPAQVRKLRRQVAQIMTLLNDKRKSA